MPAPAAPPRSVYPKLPELDDPQPGWLRKLLKPLLIAVGVVAVLVLLLSVRVEVGLPIPASGTLEPLRAWPVRSPADGMVRQVFLMTGDPVQVGSPAVQLDSAPLTATLNALQDSLRARVAGMQRTSSTRAVGQQQQRDAVARAHGRLIQARAALLQKMYSLGKGGNVDSLLSSFQPGVYPGLDTAYAGVQSTLADSVLAANQGSIAAADTSELEQERIKIADLGTQIQAVQRQLALLTVPAPASGIVVTPQTEQLLGARVETGELLMEITDPDMWSVTLTVSEREAREIEPGDSVRVTVPALDSVIRDPLRGSVLSVTPTGGGSRRVNASQQGEDDPTRVYRVVAVLDIHQLAALGTSRFGREYRVRARIVSGRAPIFQVAMTYLRKALEKVHLKR
ncbi:MAG TPA: HlyD family efflux transporter periplasmic adaptor subunit [Longimicrobiaceae bacterium]|nr:HlyD family efflux transporter periplasmic adaptor subunit [Longimicrobiaceae bacterium]